MVLCRAMGPRRVRGGAGKEYAKADSRYATRDSFVICMEAVTAFLWGPLSLLAVYAIARRWPWRHVIEAGHPPLCLNLPRAEAQT